MQCPLCGHHRTHKYGPARWGRQPYVCTDCQGKFSQRLVIPPPPQVPTRPLAPVVLGDWLLALGLFGLNLTVIHLLFPPETAYDYFLRLAQSFLAGHLCLQDNPSWLNELIPVPGKGFCMGFPVGPSILMMPLVYLFPQITQTTISHLWFGLMGAAVYGCLRQRQFSRPLAVGLACTWSFATILLSLSAVGSTWFIAHTIGNTCVFLALACLAPRRPWKLLLSGLLVGIASTTRMPMNLLMPYLVVVLFWAIAPQWQGRRDPRNRILVSSISTFIVGFLPFFLIQRFYNYVRYNSFADLGYYLLPGKFEEAAFQHGLLNPINIPRHLKVFLLGHPYLAPHPPYVLPSFNGLSILLTSPFLLVGLLWLIKQRHWLEVVTITAILGVVMSHGTVGSCQFGYRYATDAYPLLFLGFAATMRQPTWRPWMLGLIGFSVLVNLWGLFCFRYNWFILPGSCV